MFQIVTLCALFSLGSSISLRSAKSSDKKPNIVWVLADDLHFEPGQFELLPHLRHLKEQSIEFTNHVSQSPLCGPSRASLIVGRYPHNSGYKSQAAPTETFAKLHEQSVGAWLTKAGYYTAFLGKYANGIAGRLGKTGEPKLGVSDVPAGWRHFGAFTREYDQFKDQELGGAYNYYNSSQWLLDYDETGSKLLQTENSEYPIKIWTGVHQADFLGEQTVAQAQKAIAEGKPFFVFTNPAMIHHGTCDGPLPQKSDYQFDDPKHEFPAAISPCVKKGRPSSFMLDTFGSWTLHNYKKEFDQPAVGMKKMWLWPDLPAEDVDRVNMGRRNRTLSAADLDDMVGVIMAGLTKMGVMENTYFIFTSDNGFHLAEHQLFFGKELPYEHDIRVPMLIRTPSGSRNTRALPTTHVDITRTIVDLAGAGDFVTPSLSELDGKSFKDALTGDLKVTDWRRWSFSEMFEPKDGRTWRNIRYIGEDGNASWSFHLWCSGEMEVYKLTEDPHQMMNVLHPSAGQALNDFGNEIVAEWLPAINGLGSCVGDDCNDRAKIHKKPDTEDHSKLMACMVAMGYLPNGVAIAGEATELLSTDVPPPKLS